MRGAPSGGGAATAIRPGAPTPDDAEQLPTAEPDGSDDRPRWRRLLFPLLLTVLVLAAAAALVLAHNSTSTIPLAPDNPEPGGAQAAATILGDQGVQVRSATTTAEAIVLARPGSTLLITAGGLLDDDQLAAIRETGADIVITQVTFLPDLEPLTSAVEPSPAGSSEPLEAQCSDPDAQAAGHISRSTGAVVALEPQVELCFPTSDDAGAFATWSEDEQQISVLADGGLLSNDRLAEAGNAALTLRILGQHEELVWYTPTAEDPYPTGDTAAGDAQLLPPQATVIGWQLAVVAVVVLLWGSRRLGPVVTEAMPVVVRSAETTLGRGRLYRRGRSYQHAAAGLRAGCASRLARALGLPHSTSPDTLVSALARATGRDEEQIGQLLYGPPPTNDAALIRLTRELDIMESEVHRT